MGILENKQKKKQLKSQDELYQSVCFSEQSRNEILSPNPGSPNLPNDSSHSSTFQFIPKNTPKNADQYD